MPEGPCPPLCWVHFNNRLQRRQWHRVWTLQWHHSQKTACHPESLKISATCSHVIPDSSGTAPDLTRALSLTAKTPRCPKSIRPIGYHYKRDLCKPADRPPQTTNSVSYDTRVEFVPRRMFFSFSCAHLGFCRSLYVCRSFRSATRRCRIDGIPLVLASWHRLAEELQLCLDECYISRNWN